MGISLRCQASWFNRMAFSDAIRFLCYRQYPLIAYAGLKLQGDESATEKSIGSYHSSAHYDFQPTSCLV